MCVKIKLCFCFFLFFFLGLHLQHMEVPSLGVELELQLQAYSTVSHSSARSEPCLQTTPQLIAMPDLEPTERSQGSNLHPLGFQLGSLSLSHNSSQWSHRVSFIFLIKFWWAVCFQKVVHILQIVKFVGICLFIVFSYNVFVILQYQL